MRKKPYLCVMSNNKHPIKCDEMERNEEKASTEM